MSQPQIKRCGRCKRWQPIDSYKVSDGYTRSLCFSCRELARSQIATRKKEVNIKPKATHLMPEQPEFLNPTMWQAVINRGNNSASAAPLGIDAGNRCRLKP